MNFRPLIVGIIGETGSGKSTLAKELSTLLDGHIIDGDKIGHLVLLREDIITCLTKHFGDKIVQNGNIDRKILGNIVFNDPYELKFLNQIMHPIIKELIIQEIEDHHEKPYLFVDGAALIEANVLELCACTLYIKVSKEERLARLVHKRNIQKDRAQAMINAQKESEYFERHATRTFAVNTIQQDEIQPIIEFLIGFKEQL